MHSRFFRWKPFYASFARSTCHNWCQLPRVLNNSPTQLFRAHNAIAAKHWRARLFFKQTAFLGTTWEIISNMRYVCGWDFFFFFRFLVEDANIAGTSLEMKWAFDRVNFDKCSLDSIFEIHSKIEEVFSFWAYFKFNFHNVFILGFEFLVNIRSLICIFIIISIKSHTEIFV